MRSTSGLALVLCALTVAGAQDAPKPSEAVHFSSHAEMVLVPVIVTRAGKHVAGLGKDDFEIRQDGAQQNIAEFEEVRAGRPTTDLVPSIREGSEFTNIVTVHPTGFTIIVLDLTSDFASQVYLKRGALEYLKDNLNCQEPIALVSLSRSGMRVIHDFTTDPAILAAALSRIWTEVAGQDHKPDAPALPVQSESPVQPTATGTSGALTEMRMLESLFTRSAAVFDEMARDAGTVQSIAGLEGLARAYAGIPGRKSVIWLGSFPPFLPLTMLGNFPTVYIRTERLLLELATANMSIYPVDARGLVAPHSLEEPMRLENHGGSVKPVPFGPSNPLTDPRIGMMQWDADVTGGRAFVRSNDLAGSIGRAMNDSAEYYQLSYYAKPGTKPGWHTVSVKVREPHVEVRSRRGFLVPVAGKPAEPADELAAILGSPVVLTGVPLVLRWQGQSGNPGQPRRVDFEISIPPNGLWVDDGDGNHIGMTITAVAQDADRTTQLLTRDIDGRLAPDRLQQFAKSGLNYSASVEMTPGRYSVRFVVRDRISGRIGTVTAPITVR
jgi:VWFA-related protein